MSIKTWAVEIVLECKRILGIDHAATEQEVHEGLRQLKGREEIESSIKAEFEDQIKSLETKITEQSAEFLALQNQLSELQAERDTLQTNVSALTDDLEGRNTLLTAANVEIVKLKATLSDDHTGGEQGGGSQRAYEKNPLNKQYLKNRAARNA